jgi:ribosomal-protein-alanine N-acetyltransferase
MKAPVIHTNQYCVRPFQDSDAQLWQVWDTDPQVQAYMPEPKNEPQDISSQLQYIKECEEDENGYYWSIETKTGVTIGTVALTDIHTYHQLAELGIVIGDTNFWGKGVATEVIAAVVDFAFSTQNIIRISAEAESDNIAIAKVLEKVGFTQDGSFISARVKKSTRISVAHFGIVRQ